MPTYGCLSTHTVLEFLKWGWGNWRVLFWVPHGIKEGDKWPHNPCVSGPQCGEAKNTKRGFLQRAHPSEGENKSYKTAAVSGSPMRGKTWIAQGILPVRVFRLK